MYRVGELPLALQKAIAKHVPPEAMITRVEFEGPEIVIYVRNPALIASRPEIARNLAKELKKRIVFRAEKDARKPPEEAKKIIMEIVPKEAEIKTILFDEVLGEVVIKARKVGLVYGRGKAIYNKIFAETGWRPVILRAPDWESTTLNSIVSFMLRESGYRSRVLREMGERIHRGVLFENRYVRITALGGFMEVGRSAILVETGESRVLLDFGVNPGGTGYNMYPHVDVDQLRPEELDAVIVTHAHLDHMGLVPFLFKYGYRGPVFVTKPTRDLMVLSLYDYLDVASKEAGRAPFTHHDIKRMILHTIALDYGEVTDVAPDIKLTFYNAGHILGSAIAHLHIGEGLFNLVYTGDLKYAHTKLLTKAHTEFPRVEALIIESTYGNKRQPKRSQAEMELIQWIVRTIQVKKGKVLIPVLAVGRAQEILLVISEAVQKKFMPEVPVYIDGMIDEVTAIHLTYPEYLSPSLRKKILYGENPFTADYIVKVEHPSMRDEIINSTEPCIIIATSGMLNGGPSVEYFRKLAGDPRNTLIFVSYQVKGTLGRRVLEAGTGGQVTLVSPDGKLEVIKINMDVVSVEGFSGHSDIDQLIAFLRDIKPKPKYLILNHGEPEAIYKFKARIERECRKGGKLEGSPFCEPGRIYTPSNLDSLLLTR